jgi:peptidoglycan hydrolase-like protein with peptidoglycan-binding domain
LAASSGAVVLVAFGLLALAMSPNSGCGSDGDSADQADQGNVDVDTADEPTCDGVVVVQSASGSTSVPGGEVRADSSTSVACDMREGDVDEDAVRAVQAAMVRCNGQDVTVDGNFGPETRAALAQIQQQSGLSADGFYGPATREAMQWPATSASGTTVCISNVSSSTAPDEGS